MKKVKNQIITSDNYSELLIYDSEGNLKAKFLIDSDDVNRVSEYHWCFNNNYARS
jgi:hypothetical protein